MRSKNGYHYSQNVVQIKSDSFIGVAMFKWQQSQLSNIMNYLNFEYSNKGNVQIYKKKVKLTYQCTVSAYPSGTVMLSGCHSQQEMQDIIQQLVEKIKQLENSNVKLINELKVVSFRCKIQFKKMFNIIKLSQVIHEYENQANSNQHSLKKQRCQNPSKVLLPEHFHHHKNLTLFVVRLGYIQLYKANLIQDLLTFADNLYSSFLIHFAVQKSFFEIPAKKKNKPIAKQKTTKKLAIKQKKIQQQDKLNRIKQMLRSKIQNRIKNSQKKKPEQHLKFQFPEQPSQSFSLQNSDQYNFYNCYDEESEQGC